MPAQNGQRSQKNNNNKLFITQTDDKWEIVRNKSHKSDTVGANCAENHAIVRFD